jgi:hypothetical protein
MNDAPHWISFLPIIFVILSGFCMLFALMAIPIIVFVVHGRKKKAAAKHFTQLADSFGTRMHCSYLTNTYSMQGSHHDVPYELRYYGGGNPQQGGSSGSITISVPVKPLFTLSLRKEDFDTKLSKKIGMATELEIGVPDFDAEFFIRTNDPTNCRLFLSVPKHRAAIRHIYQQGYTLAFTRRRIELRKGVKALLFADNDIVEASETKGVLNAVVVLVRGLQTTR